MADVHGGERRALLQRFGGIHMKMRCMLVFLVGSGLMLTAAPADFKALVRAAVSKLEGAPNYSWTTTSQAQGGTATWQLGPVEGQTEKAGMTHFVGSFNENRFEVAIQGSRFALKRGEAWESSPELERSNPRLAQRIKDFMVPAAEAAALLGQAKELQPQAEGAVTAELTERGVREILGRWWRGDVEPSGLKGRVRFWVQDGVLSKYEYTVQAKLRVGQDRPEVEVHRTVTVEIKGVGTTRVNLPEEVKKMLAGGAS